MMSNGEGEDLPTMTRRNLQNFTTEKRRETARRRGRSTPSPSPDFHEYDDISSEDLRPPSQRLQRRYPKPTASEVAADYPKWLERVNANVPRAKPITWEDLLQPVECRL